MTFPEPLYDEKYAPNPWYWHVDVQDGIPWAVGDKLRGVQHYHVVTTTDHYPTREAAIADLKRAFEEAGVSPPSTPPSP